MSIRRFKVSSSKDERDNACEMNLLSGLGKYSNKKLRSMSSLIGAELPRNMDITETRDNDVGKQPVTK